MHSEKWLLFLFENTIKATVVLLAAYALSLAWRRASAASRHLVWTLAILCLPALPILSPLLPAWRIAPRLPAAQTQARPEVAPFHAAKPRGETIQLRSASLPPTAATAARWDFWALPVWAAGALVALTRLLIGAARVRWMRHRGERIDAFDGLIAEVSEQIGLRRGVCVLESTRVSMPMTWGVWRPLLLLPAEARHWSPERLRLVLSHELVHVKRQDCLTQLFTQVGCALYWFHSLVWLAAGRLRKERERACDDAVLRLGIKGSQYAEHLLDLVRSLQANERWSAAVAMAQPADLETRLVALLNPNLNRQALTRRSALAAALAAACLILPLAAVRAQAPGATGKISGTVYDASGAAIPAATVTALNLDTKGQEITSSNDAGEFTFAAIPRGRYILEVGNKGFAVQRKDVVLAADADVRLAMTLEIGSVTETVDVIGKSPRISPPSPGGIPRRIRVGGNVQATRLVSSVKPPYPEWLQAQGTQGPVVLRAIIAMDGGLAALSVVNTPPDPELARAAMEAVQQWRYQPTLLNGQPVEVVTTITVNFRLQP